MRRVQVNHPGVGGTDRFAPPGRTFGGCGGSQYTMVANARRTGGQFLAIVALAAVVHGGAAYGYDNDPADSIERARALWKEGAGLHVEADYQGAIDRYRRALRLHPTARTHTYMAWSLGRLGRYREAVSHCRRAIRLDPGYPNAYNDLGAYLIELGRPGEAIPWLRRAVGLSDYCCRHYAHFQLGRALLLQARVQEARRELETSLSIRPDYRIARWLLQGIRLRGLKGL